MKRPISRAGSSVSVLIAALITASCGGSASYYLQSGDQNFKAGKFSDAVLNYRKAIQKNPDLGEAYYGLGRAYVERKDYQEAFEALTRASELLPRRIDIKAELADVVLSVYENDLSNASLYGTLTKITNEIVALDPNSYDGLRLKGNLALFDRKPEQAIESFQRANQIKPLQDYLVVGYSQALIEAGRGPEAEAIARQLIERKKDFGPIYDVLFQYYSSTGNGEAAEAILREKIRNNPTDSSAFIQLASYYQQAQKTAAVQAVLNELLDSYATRKDAFLLTGDFYAHFDEWEEAASTYEKGIRLQPGQTSSFKKRMAGVRVAQGRQGDALVILDEVLAKTPADRDAEVAKAGLLVQRAGTGDVDKAIAIYQTVLKARPGDDAARMGLGQAYFAKGDFASARNQLQSAAQNDPTAEEPRILLATVSVIQKKPAEAVDVLDQVLSHSPGNTRALYLRVCAQMMLGRYDDARPDLEKLSREFPESGDLNLLRGILAIMSKRYQEAEAIFSKLTANGTDPRFASGLAEAFVGQRQFDKALQSLETEARKSPNEPVIGEMLAKTAARAGQYDRAIAEFQKLLRTQPGSIELLTDLGQAYQAKGDLPKAAEVFQKAAQQGSKDPLPFFLLGYTLSESGKPSEAIQSYRQALALQPNNPLSLNNLAFVLAKSGDPRNLDDALKFAQQAIAISPHEPELQDTLGFVWLKKGNSDEALRLFTEASTGTPANPSYRHHMGLALLAKGNTAEAQRTLAAALAANPSPTEAAEIRDAIGHASSRP
jgi:tetratricopeptide (TPR) repeat protein